MKIIDFKFELDPRIEPALEELKNKEVILIK